MTHEKGCYIASAWHLCHLGGLLPDERCWHWRCLIAAHERVNDLLQALCYELHPRCIGVQAIWQQPLQITAESDF